MKTIFKSWFILSIPTGHKLLELGMHPLIKEHNDIPLYLVVE